MGSKGSKPHKDQGHLPKVPKYEEPNTMPLAGLSAQEGPHPGRLGHSAGGHRGGSEPGRFGRLLLRMLGRKPGEHI